MASPAVADSFYSASPELLQGRPGSLIRARPVRSSPPALPSASRSFQVLYRSRSASGRPIAVSGIIDLPKGVVPQGGFKVISWGHGTTGAADHCAPSRNFKSGSQGFSFTYADRLSDSWLRRGFAVVRTDYPGLGTPGPHPYLSGPDAGRAMVDIVSAAHQLSPELSPDFVLAGHSQGGHAALFGAEGADAWAPRLRLQGALAVAPGSHILQQESLPALRGRLDAISAFAWMIWSSAARLAGLRPEQVFKPQFAELPARLEQRCLIELLEQGRSSTLAAHQFFRPGPDYPGLLRVMREMHPLVDSPVPLGVLQGGSDELAEPRFTDRLVRQLKRRSNQVAYVVKPSADHVDIVSGADAMLEINRWIDIRFSSGWGSWGSAPGPSGPGGWRNYLPPSDRDARLGL